MTRLISSSQHPLIKHLVKLRQDSAYRTLQQTTLLEGSKSIREVLSHVIRIFYTAEWEGVFSEQGRESWCVTDIVMHKLSNLLSPEGVVAEVRLPSFQTLEAYNRILVLDGVADPGNVGTLLRTALAFDWGGAYFLPGCCDPFNDKALRAAKGAQFKLPLAKGTVEEMFAFGQKNHYQMAVADIQGMPASEVPQASKRLLVLGNEARGPSQLLQAQGLKVTLPMPGPMESLNVAVAGGILLYLL